MTAGSRAGQKEAFDMNYSIGNHLLSAEIRSEGAELGSLKKDGLEYVWEADPLHWGHSAPILFPVVGGLKEGRTRIEGKPYTMAKHGFFKGTRFFSCPAVGTFGDPCHPK